MPDAIFVLEDLAVFKRRIAGYKAWKLLQVIRANESFN